MLQISNTLKQWNKEFSSASKNIKSFLCRTLKMQSSQGITFNNVTCHSTLTEKTKESILKKRKKKQHDYQKICALAEKILVIEILFYYES